MENKNGRKLHWYCAKIIWGRGAEYRKIFKDLRERNGIKYSKSHRWYYILTDARTIVVLDHMNKDWLHVFKDIYGDYQIWDGHMNKDEAWAWLE